MRYIEKHAEPDSLTAYKKQANAYYDGCNKADIRENACYKTKGTFVRTACAVYLKKLPLLAVSYR